jgi:hypothetical protein
VRPGRINPQGVFVTLRRTEGVRKIAERMGVNPSTIQAISMELAERPFGGHRAAITRCFALALKLSVLAADGFDAQASPCDAHPSGRIPGSDILSPLPIVLGWIGVYARRQWLWIELTWNKKRSEEQRTEFVRENAANLRDMLSM